MGRCKSLCQKAQSEQLHGQQQQWAPDVKQLKPGLGDDKGISEGTISPLQCVCQEATYAKTTTRSF